MLIKFIYNTQGNYVAFVADNNLFSTHCQWLGVIRDKKIVYDIDGNYIGYITNDHRVAKDKINFRKKQIDRPLQPRKPFRPFKPIKRRSMISIPHPYSDFFQDFSAPKITLTKKKFNNLINSMLIANDGVFLGIVTRNRFRDDSISNPYGKYGSDDSETSIFNKFGKYGSKYIELSPFNKNSQVPPTFQKEGKILGYLTAGEFGKNRIDVTEFIAWLEI